MSNFNFPSLGFEDKKAKRRMKDSVRIHVWHVTQGALNIELPASIGPRGCETGASTVLRIHVLGKGSHHTAVTGAKG